MLYFVAFVMKNTILNKNLNESFSSECQLCCILHTIDNTHFMKYALKRKIRDYSNSLHTN